MIMTKVGKSDAWEMVTPPGVSYLLGDVSAPSLAGLHERLSLLRYILPEPPAIPLPGWVKVIGLPTGPRFA